MRKLHRGGKGNSMPNDTAATLNKPLAQRVRRVPVDRPWLWISAGWADLQRARAIGWAYGMALVLAGWCLTLLLFEADTLWATLPATAGTGFGLVLAAVSFAITVVSIPMLVDRDISALEAVTVSIQAAMTNWRAMLLWSGLIVRFTGLALVPFYLGLVVALPVIGHATWHAYRDLVVE